MSASARARAKRLRWRLAARWRYLSFRREVEPALLAQPRVERFAAPPAVGPANTKPAPLEVYAHADATALARTLRETQSVWVVLVQPGARLAPVALERLGQALTLAPDAVVITCDDDLLDRTGRRSQPRLRPGPAPDSWLARDPDFPLLAVAREPALQAIEKGGEHPHLLFLRLCGRNGAGHAHVPLVLCHRPRGEAARAREVHRNALDRVLAEWGEPARLEAVGGRRRVRRPVGGEPLVEVIVPFRDRPELLERCARSVLERSTYERLGLRLVDNASTDPATGALLDRLGADPRVSTDSDPRPFNFSALNNAAARRSTAEVLVFLNNDTEVITPDWIEGLLEEAQRPAVGAVGPLLLLADGRVQHAGVALGIHGWAGHPFAGLDPERETPLGAASEGTRNWLAVSAACLMVERRKLCAVGGFDESFAVGGGDVDLCLRLTAAGYRSLCVSHVRLLHEESATREPAAIPPGDFEASRRSYGAFRTLGDPFYHPALTLRDTSCRLRSSAEGAAVNAP